MNGSDYWLGCGQPATNSDHRVLTGEFAHLVEHLKKVGISQRKAAPLLGVTFEHLNRCLNGHRTSRSLMERISKLNRPN